MKLDEYMKDQNLTQADLAARLDVTPSAVCMWLAGKRRPRFETLARLEQTSNGAVTANDFMPSQSQSQEARQ